MMPPGISWFVATRYFSLSPNDSVGFGWNGQPGRSRWQPLKTWMGIEVAPKLVAGARSTRRTKSAVQHSIRGVDVGFIRGADLAGALPRHQSGACGSECRASPGLAGWPQAGAEQCSALRPWREAVSQSAGMAVLESNALLMNFRGVCARLPALKMNSRGLHREANASYLQLGLASTFHGSFS